MWTVQALSTISPTTHNLVYSIEVQNRTPMTFSTAQINSLKALIEFHDDWEEVSELLGTDIETLYDVVCSLESND